MDEMQAEPPPDVIYRHTRVVRITHWINVLCLSLLLMSGLQILNAHPALYWGQKGADSDPAFIEIGARAGDDEALKGFARIGPLEAPTTGFLGVSKYQGNVNQVAFPSWLTVPSWRDLATGRRWHFFFAWLFVLNGATYLTFGLLNGHFRRDLLLKREELKPRHLVQDVWNHLRLRFPKGEEAKRYNTLQKLAYVTVIFGLLPTMVLTGLTMSPGFDAIGPVLLNIFGGRQSARTIHFIAANLLVLFLIVHVVQVVLVGAVNEIRSMITGRYVVPAEGGK